MTMDESSDDSNKDGSHLEMASLVETEKVKNKEESKNVTGDMNLPSISSPCSNFFALLLAYASYGVQYAPRTCFWLAVIGLVFPSYFIVADVFFNPTEHFGEILNDYSDLSVQSKLDSLMKNIDHWCLGGGNDSCRCEDPTLPTPRFDYRRWSNAHAGNKMQIENMIKQDFTTPDIAFLGASVIEKMDGRWFGDISGEGLNEVANIFDKHFGKDGSMSAVALGIAADTNQSVLWRILNGEMPAQFNPKIWWLELGLNDLGRSRCSEEVVVIGVLRVVEEIMRLKPDAKIVVNSLFPMADFRSDRAPTTDDLKRSFGTKPERARNQPRPGSNTVNRPGKQKNPRNFRPRDFGKKEIGKQAPRERNPVKNEGPGQRRNNRILDGTENQGRRNLNQERSLRDRDTFRNRSREKNQVKLLDKTSQQKYNQITRTEQKMPLWTSIQAVNIALRKFCNSNENVFFFDSTSIFTERDGLNYNLKTDMITIRGLPTNEGFVAWENAVAYQARRLLG